MYPVNLSKGEVLKVGFKLIENRRFESKIIKLDGVVWMESENLIHSGYKLEQSKCFDIAQAESFMFSDGFR